MYKPIDRSQHSFLDFNQPMGLHMNPDNRWIKMADRILYNEYQNKSKRFNFRDVLLYQIFTFISSVVTGFAQAPAKVSGSLQRMIIII